MDQLSWPPDLAASGPQRGRQRPACGSGRNEQRGVALTDCCSVHGGLGGRARRPVTDGPDGASLSRRASGLTVVGGRRRGACACQPAAWVPWSARWRCSAAVCCCWEWRRRGCTQRGTGDADRRSNGGQKWSAGLQGPADRRSVAWFPAELCLTWGRWAVERTAPIANAPSSSARQACRPIDALMEPSDDQRKVLVARLGGRWGCSGPRARRPNWRPVTTETAVGGRTGRDVRL